MQFFSALYRTLCEHADSRKSTGALAGMLLIAFVFYSKKLGWEIDPDTMKWAAGTISAVACVYLHAQGKADAAAGGSAGKPAQTPTSAALAELETRVEGRLLGADGDTSSTAVTASQQTLLVTAQKQ